MSRSCRTRAAPRGRVTLRPPIPGQMLRVAGTVLGLTMAWPAALAAQVPSVVAVRDGLGATMVYNHSRHPMAVTMELRHGSVSDGQLTLGPAVEALVSPRQFTLQPAGSQVVRILLRERAPAGTVFRLVTTLTPVLPDPETRVTVAQARLVYATRLITKVVAR